MTFLFVNINTECWICMIHVVAIVVSGHVLIVVLFLFC